MNTAISALLDQAAIVRRMRPTDESYTPQELLARLSTILTDLHLQGEELHAACPRCGYNHRPSGRFFCTPLTGYAVWVCRHCRYKASTRSLLGEPCPGQDRRGPYPLPKASTSAINPPKAKPIPKPPLDIPAIRREYARLALFARLHVGDQARRWLASRFGGDKVKEAIDIGRLGYIDTKLARQFWRRSTPEQQKALIDSGLYHANGKPRTCLCGYRGKVVIPFYHEGQVVNLRFRAISPKDRVKELAPKGRYEKRGAVYLWKSPGMGLPDQVIITEGAIKALAVTIGYLRGELGCPAVAMRGTSEWYDPYEDTLRGRTVLVCMDREESGSGDLAAAKVAHRLQQAGIWALILHLPANGEKNDIDSFILSQGYGAMRQVIDSSLTLAEFVTCLSPEQVEQVFKKAQEVFPTQRRWTRPGEAEVVKAPETEVCLGETRAELRLKILNWLKGWKKGRGKLGVALGAGVGKTETAAATLREWAQKNDKTIAFILPNHAVIEEKVRDGGPLEGFKHVYGHRQAEEGKMLTREKNCRQAHLCQALIAKGYNAAALVCTKKGKECPHLQECRSCGYHSQFGRKANRAYVHAHVFTHFPEGEDVVVLDDFTPSNAFVEQVIIREHEVTELLRDGVRGQQREVCQALLTLFTEPGLADLEGIELYVQLIRAKGDLITNRAAWQDGEALRACLQAYAFDVVKGLDPPDDLPYNFSDKLWSVLTKDVERMAQGRSPTGRLRLAVIHHEGKEAGRYLELNLRRPKMDWMSTRPVIVMNATGQRDLWEDLLGPFHEFYAPEVEMMAGSEYVADVRWNNAKTSILAQEGYKQRWLTQIEGYIAGAQRPGIIAALDVEPNLREHFGEAAKIGHYGYIHGTNRFEDCDVLVLATPPALNTDIALRQARALWDDVDDELTRKFVAFDWQGEDGELAGVGQVEAVDPRVSALIRTMRDAQIEQAVHRARLYTSTAKVVTLFARPAPGLKPTQVIHKRDRPTRATRRRTATLMKLMEAARELAATEGGWTVASLMKASGVGSKHTILKYADEVSKRLGAVQLALPAIQQLAHGARVPRTLTLHAVQLRNTYPSIVNVHSVKTLWLPESYELTPKALELLRDFYQRPEPADERRSWAWETYLDSKMVESSTLPLLPQGYEWVKVGDGPPIPF